MLSNNILRFNEKLEVKGIRDKVSMLQELMDNGEDVTDLINIYDMTSQHDPEIKNYNRLYKGRGKILNPHSEKEFWPPPWSLKHHRRI